MALSGGTMSSPAMKNPDIMGCWLKLGLPIPPPVKRGRYQKSPLGLIDAEASVET
jgi:hypothetical protein